MAWYLQVCRREQRAVTKVSDEDQAGRRGVLSLLSGLFLSQSCDHVILAEVDVIKL
jgi:hypothetical protein